MPLQVTILYIEKLKWALDMINGNGMAFRNQKCDLPRIAEMIDLFIYQFWLFLVILRIVRFLTCNSEKESQNCEIKAGNCEEKK